ncbi:hypothetical protein ACYX7F_00610 [Sphingobacterium hungaricum]
MPIKLLVSLAASLLLFACCSSSKTQIHFETDKIDSFKVELFNPITGMKLFSETLSGPKKTLYIDSAINDPVEVRILWHREHIPHSIVKPMQKHEAFYGPTEDYFVLHKMIFINSGQSKEYILKLPNKTTAEIEQAVKDKTDYSNIELATSSEDANLFEEYMGIYATYEDKLADSLASLNRQLYASNDAGNFEESKQIQSTIAGKGWKDAIRNQNKQAISKKITAHNESPISAFILLWEIYAYKSPFDEYATSFQTLENDAVKNKYYVTIEQNFVKK